MSGWQLQLIARTATLSYVAGLAGCGDVFGLDELPEVQDVALTSRVQGRVWERYVTNGTDLTPILVDHVNSELAISASLEGGLEVPVTYNDDGSFELYRAGDDQLYRLVLTVDDNELEFQLTNADVVLPRLVAGRPMRRPQAVSYFQFPYPAAAADLLGAHVSTTGIYSLTYSGLFGPTVTFDWRTAAATTNARLGMLDASENDRAYVLEFRVDRTSFAPLAYQVITGVGSLAVTQAVGQRHTLPGTTAVQRNHCARMHAPNATQVKRLDDAIARTHVYSGGDWHVFGVPIHVQAALSGLTTLAVAGQVPAVDSEIVATFHDPYPGWSRVGQAGALLGFDTLLPGTTNPVRLYDYIRSYRVLESTPLDCSQPAVNMTPDIAVPGTIAIAGAALVSDGQVVTLPEGDIEVTWSSAGEGAMHHATVAVHELIAADSFTTNVRQHAVSTAGQRVVLDRGLFASGRTYMILVTHAMGRPGVIDGDWSILDGRVEQAGVWSRYFTVR